MSPRPLKVDVPLVYSRHSPVCSVVDASRAIQASGVVDSVTIWDQMTFFAPPRLWNPQSSPLAAVIPDIDSWPDPYIVLGQIGAACPGLGLTTTSDAVRRGPAELTQSLLTLAQVTGSPTMVQMGAGELKQTKPFGHKRTQGIGRFEDTFEIFRKFMDDMDPIDHDGNYWKLENAWLGGARPLHRPELWALGAGPRLINATAKFGDGFCTAAPFVWSTPEQAHERINAIKQIIERNGRDPDEFGFGLWWICLMHEDREVIEQAMTNDYVRWIATTLGRFNPEDWQAIGIDPPMGTSWHYATKMLPITLDEQETADVLGRATDDIVHNGWFHGSPTEMADQIQPFLEAGVNWVQIADMLPITRPLEEAAECLGRTLEVAALIKQRP
ncbi:LLM class flavin-dependent oxidoreductase [Mycobacterium sp.]|uniref:LLM class flavin-dependent oxidoreductase n=1 Tax=Mycobacterium sp. TaxID=1785 RepID=UPI00120350C5|nr:LLM class flavin-dependent oxidoreductase [Mycobacterium sp.]TAM70239.1 MAG: LLM class flavin-dependent oxidoreductase [Mycobacterium sp.]